MTEVQIAHGINLALSWFTTIPNHWLYTAGVVAASIPLTAVVVQFIKHLHLKMTATEMTNHLIDFVVLVTGFLMAAADFVITNGNNLKYLPQFLLVVVPTIKALAPSVYSYSKAVNGWFINRRAENQKQRLAAVLTAADSLSAPESQPPQTPTPGLFL